MPDYDDLFRRMEERLEADAKEKEKLMEELRSYKDKDEASGWLGGPPRLNKVKRKRGLPHEDH